MYSTTEAFTYVYTYVKLSHKYAQWLHIRYSKIHPCIYIKTVDIWYLHKPLKG
jgi:hypothetical protein